MKVVFLDIDGVLNSTRSTFVKIGPSVEHLPFAAKAAFAARFALMCADPVCVALVNRLLIDTGATLVLCSSHRKFFMDEHTSYGSQEHLRRLRTYLEIMGVRVTATFDITPELHTARGHEVQAWIDTNGDPERYVILDDGRDFMGYQPHIWCDPVHGFDFADYGDACTLL
jgi:hypothetical protein